MTKESHVFYLAAFDEPVTIRWELYKEPTQMDQEVIFTTSTAISQDCLHVITGELLESVQSEITPSHPLQFKISAVTAEGSVGEY